MNSHTKIERRVAKYKTKAVEHKRMKKLMIDTNRRLQDTSQKLFMAKKELEKKNKELEKARQREKQQREELQRELRDLKHLAGTRGEKKAFKKDLVINSYSKVIREYITQENITPAKIVEETARDFFEKGISGKDVIDIHLQAMDILTKGLQDNLARKVVEPARFLLLGVMANLADLYRKKIKGR